MSVNKSMSMQTTNVAFVGNEEIGKEISVHLSAFGEKCNLVSRSNTIEFLFENSADVDILYFDSSELTEENNTSITELCDQNNIALVKLVHTKNDECESETDSIDPSLLVLPITVKDLSLSLLLCSQKMTFEKNIKDEKNNLEEIMNSLAKSNVRSILLNEALQKLRILENTLSKRGGFLSYICDFLNSVKNVAAKQNCFFIVFDKNGSIYRLYNWENQIKDITTNAEISFLADEMFADNENRSGEYSRNNRNFAFEYVEDEKDMQMTGIPVFVNKNLYGAVISTDFKETDCIDHDSNENTISLLASELEKSLERIVLDSKIKSKNKALLTTNSRLDFLLRSNPAVLFDLSNTNALTFDFISENVKKLTGYTAKDLVGSHDLYQSIVHEDDLDNFKSALETLKTKGSCIREYRVNTKSGRTIWVHEEIIAHLNSSGEISNMVGYLIDIDAQVKSHEEMIKQNSALEEAYVNLKLAKDQLLQSDKLASIGQLAAGVAHEINNPVGYISSNLSSLKSYVNDLINVIESISEPLTKDNFSSVSDNVIKIKKEIDYNYIKEDLPDLLDQSLDGVKRVKQIVQDLKDFSHADEGEWQFADIHKGIDSTLNIVNNEIKYKSEIVKEYGDIPEVECILSQLNQVFMNLLVNAAHAIQDQGTITIKTWSERDNVLITISDDGEGIKPESLQRLFEPFYTTKPVGEGTGLGLSLSYGIIERHKGVIEVESELGKGTTFTVVLPILQNRKNDLELFN